MRRGLDGGPLQRPGRGGPSREHGRADTRVKVTSCVSPRTCLQMCPDHMEAERLQAAGHFSLTPHTAPSSCRRAPTTCPAPPGPAPRASSWQHPQAEPGAPAADHPRWPSPPGLGGGVLAHHGAPASGASSLGAAQRQARAQSKAAAGPAVTVAGGAAHTRGGPSRQGA